MFKNWKNRILDHEETPPKSVWDSISDKLDAEDAADQLAFVSRLNKIGITPPVSAWENIAAELDNENVARPGRSNGKLIGIYRKLAIAAAVLVITGLTIFITNKTSSPKGTSIARNILPIEKITTPIKTNDQIKDTNTIAISNPVKSNFTSNKKVAKTDFAKVLENNTIEPIAYTKQEIIPLANVPFLDNDKISNPDGSFSIDADKMGAPNTYVMATLGPNGESIKVSSKLKDYIGYLSDKSGDTEEYLDKIIKGSNEWKARIKQWSQKLINDNVSPSFNNFLDVFELSNLLQEKK